MLSKITFKPKKNILSFYKNPFPKTDTDRYQIWEMLVERDIIAFCKQDWGMVADDFIEENFMGIDAGGKQNPDSWKISFAELDAYKQEWLKQSQEFAGKEWAEDAEKALYEATQMRDIEIQGNSALIHKKFDGQISKKDGSSARLNWQTLYRCRKIDGKWKIAGFTGYMPFQWDGDKMLIPWN